MLSKVSLENMLMLSACAKGLMLLGCSIYCPPLYVAVCRSPNAHAGSISFTQDTQLYDEEHNAAVKEALAQDTGEMVAAKLHSVSVRVLQ